MLTCENKLKAYFKINTFELVVSIPIIKKLQNLFFKKPRKLGTPGPTTKLEEKNTLDLGTGWQDYSGQRTRGQRHLCILMANIH